MTFDEFMSWNAVSKLCILFMVAAFAVLGAKDGWK